MVKQVVIASQSFGRAQPKGAEILREAGFTLKYLTGVGNAHDELSKLMRDPQTIAVVAGAEPIDADMINLSPNLKVIAMHGVGLNHIDQQAAQLQGIVVKAVPGGNAEAVADLAFGLMFAASRHIVRADRAVRTGNWKEKFVGTALNDKMLGLVGFGAIGQAVAKRAQGFNMTILAYDVVVNETVASSLGTRFVPFEELLSQADIISLHLPLIDSTTNLINETSLRMMKSSAILINTSRGGIVDESALYKALKENWIAAAGLDVVCQEPLPGDHPFIQLENIVLTPHIGARTHETVRYIGICTAENILEVLKTY